jgi:hypothetical protein
MIALFGDDDNLPNDVGIFKFIFVLAPKLS